MHMIFILAHIIVINMKSGKPKKAPKVAIPPKKKPFAYEKTKDAATERKSPQAPMTKKRLSK